jgi:PAS domain S-box-containing protein
VATALTDASGRVTSVLGVTRDITERKRAEVALRESEERHRSLFDQSPIGIYRTTPDGRILAANGALLLALGYASLEELTARNLDLDGYEPTYPRQEFKERIERDGEVIGFESAWLKKDGQVLGVRESARVVRDQDGKTLYYEGTIEDVTAQRRGEEERRHLVAAIEQASETIVITDTEGRIEYVNPAFERTSGYTRGEANGQKLSMLDSGEHDDAYYATLWQTITQSEMWQGHFVNRRKDGSLYEEEATISPIRDSRGTIVNFVEVKRDVTQEMALQMQLRQAQKMEAVGILAGGVAHDFNNLLQAMLNNVELVQGRHGDAAQMAATMAELEAEIRRGSALTRQLLLFARRETAKPERFDLNDGIRGVATFLRRLVRANISYSMDLADEPLPVTADRGQIDQVLMNLVVNAADAMPGGGRLTIRSGRQGEEWVWFAAEDTGSGIPVEVRERIFEPFFTTKGKGTGLGLSVVHGIVTQHGGVVTFEDRPGGGTSFRVALPRTGSGEHPEVILPTVDTSSSPAGHGERVLVVEDEEGARQGLAEILRMLAYDVVAVGSGEEAGLLPHDPGFDVLLTDMMLPGCAGSDLARGLLERWPTLKVILMSGYAEDEAVRRGALAGRIRFLQKPFDMATLAREIRAALDSD